MTPSLDSIIERLKTRGGRDFTLAVLDAFEFLGFEVEDIEKTQGTQAHSDLIVKASLATNPYFAVLECSAVREGSEVGYTNLYQLGSSFPRYVTKYSKDYPSASYKMLVGRPLFSRETKEMAKDETLMTAEILVELLKGHDEIYLSQDELERIFRFKGELTEKEVHRIAYPYLAKAWVYAWVYLSFLKDPTDTSKRKRESINIEGVVALAKHWGSLLEDAEIPDDYLQDAIRDLSSPVLRMLTIDGQNVILSSLPLTKIIQNMGDLGQAFKKYLTKSINKAKTMKESLRT